MGLCNACVAMLQEGRGYVWAGTLDLTFKHHDNTASLRQSQELDCSICTTLANFCQKNGIDMFKDQALAIMATLRKISSQDGFKLDFDIEKRHARTFLLEPIGALSDCSLHGSQYQPNECRFRHRPSEDTKIYGHFF